MSRLVFRQCETHLSAFKLRLNWGKTNTDTPEIYVYVEFGTHFNVVSTYILSIHATQMRKVPIKYLCAGYMNVYRFACWVISHVYFSLDIYPKWTFSKLSSGLPSECQTVLRQFKINVLSSLVLVQTDYKGYQL